MRFEVGDKVVYPNHGVGIIEEVRQREIAGSTQDFYHLRILANQTIVMVPLGNSKSVGLRRIFDSDDVNELYKHIRSAEFETHSNWKGRYKEHAEKMRSGHLFEMAEVLKNLMHLSKRKALSYREKRMYEKAKHLIVSEVAMVEDRGEHEVLVDIEKALEVSIEARKKEEKKAS